MMEHHAIKSMYHYLCNYFLCYWTFFSVINNSVLNSVFYTIVASICISFLFLLLKVECSFVFTYYFYFLT